MRYSRPAVYIERADAAGPEPVVLRTDVAALIGIATRGPIDTPVPVESFRQFNAHFGEFTGAGYLAYAVRGFFENGGRRCWAVRVASREAAGGAQPASAAVADVSAAPAMTFYANSAGTWGNAVTLEFGLERGPTAIADPRLSTPVFASVLSVANFEPSALARIEQQGVPTGYRVISAVDTAMRRVYWVHPDPGAGLPTDRALAGFDLTRPIRISRVSYSITVREAGVVRAVYRDVNIAPTHPRYAPILLAAPVYTPYWLLRPDQATASDLPRPAEPIVAASMVDEPTHIPLPLDVTAGVELPLAGGTDGLAALAPYDFIGEPVVPGDSDFVKARKQRGMETLADIGEVALVAIPDILLRPEPDPVYDPVPPPVINPCIACPPPPPAVKVHQPLPPGELPPVFTDAQIAAVQSALLEFCERMDDRFAVLSLPFTLAADPIVSRDAILEWRTQFESRYGALYAPWLDVIEPRRTVPVRRIPACGHIVGAIARTDLAWGVHRAPGNLPLSGVVDLSRLIGDTDHGEFNSGGVDVLRSEFGRQPAILGARTLSHDPAWRFVNIVRLVLAIKKGIDLALRWAVFEPNDHTTRSAVASTLIGLLQLFFERGAFRGATPEESYFVRCDEVSTPPEARDLGQLIALVGIAPAAPCEFIVLRVGKQGNTLAVSLFEAGEAVYA